MGSRWRTVHGYPRSRGADDAEFEGEMPMTRAVEAVYQLPEIRAHKVSRRVIRDFLGGNCARGAHHVAGYGEVRLVGYYATRLSPDQIQALIALAQQSKRRRQPKT